MSGSNVLSAFKRPLPIHESLKPLQWLIGRWRTEAPAIGNRTLPKTFSYCEELEFLPYGRPALSFRTLTWKPDTTETMHMESGFLRLAPDTQKLEFIVAHIVGATTIEEGEVVGHNINLKSTGVGWMTTAEFAHVTKVERTFRLTDEGLLEQIIFMETTTTPFTEHTRAVYRKVNE